MRSLKDASQDLGRRFKQPVVKEAAATGYYSTWEYAALHMLITIPKYQNIRPLSLRINLSTQMTEYFLENLQTWGLAKREGASWKTTNKSIHIPRGHPLTKVNHTNWRLRSLVQHKWNESDDVHYSSVYTLSIKDARQLQLQVLEFIDKTRKLVVASTEEEAVAFLVDFFTI